MNFCLCTGFPCRDDVWKSWGVFRELREHFVCFGSLRRVLISEMAMLKTPEQKVILCGEYGVGKSSLFRRFMTDSFVANSDRKSTLGLDHYEKIYTSADREIKLQLWDTGGMERVASVTSSYYKFAEAAVLVFAANSRDSFNALSVFHNVVSAVYKTSCRTGEGVEEMFDDIAKLLLEVNRSRMELEALEQESFRLLECDEPPVQDQCIVTFPSSFSAEERKFVRFIASLAELDCFSEGSFPERTISIRKRNGPSPPGLRAKLSLTALGRFCLEEFHKDHPSSDFDAKILKSLADGQFAKQSQEIKDVFQPQGRIPAGDPRIPVGPSSTRMRQELLDSRPILKYASAVLSHVQNNRYLMIHGETGCGKSTQVPQLIMDNAIDKDQHVRIISVQPRSLNAIQLAERVAHERGNTGQNQIGCVTRMEPLMSSNGVLTFTTLGSLTRTLAVNGHQFFRGVTHLIIDEVQEHGIKCDVLLADLKFKLSFSRGTKLILLSAFADLKLSAYFDDCSMLGIPPSKESTHSVKEVFLEEVLSSVGFTCAEMEAEKALAEASCSEKLQSWKQKPKNGVSNVEEGHHTPENPVNSDAGGQNRKESFDCLLESAMNAGSPELFDRILQSITDRSMHVNHEHSKIGLTALMCAAYGGREDVVKELLSLKASVKARTRSVDPDLQLSASDWSQIRGEHRIQRLLNESQIGCTETWDEDLELVLRSNQMDLEAKKSLSYYLRSIKEPFVDSRVLLELLLNVNAERDPGAIMVFLPSYEFILAIREKILEDPRFTQCVPSFRIFMMHEAMRSTDLPLVMQTCEGSRKLILATSMAEFSITVPDVRFVVDCGRIQDTRYSQAEKTFLSQLYWISKNTARVRSGRARASGCCVSYRLYTQARFEQMPEVSPPQLHVAPLEKICLRVKGLTSQSISIVEFFKRTIDPPPEERVDDALRSLMDLEALDASGELTLLGLYLLEMPIQPRLGKMILYAMKLKCLEPVLTIVSALRVKNVFRLPQDEDHVHFTAQARKSLVEDIPSDLLALLRAFQSWSKAKAEGSDREKRHLNRFCLSQAALEEVSSSRRKIIAAITTAGVLKCRSPAEMRALNLNSEQWPVVKFAVLAALGENVCLLNASDSSYGLDSPFESDAKIDSKSLVKLSKKGLPSGANSSASWIMFQERKINREGSTLGECDVISAASVILACGPILLDNCSRLRPRGPCSEGFHAEQWDEHSDSESEADGGESHNPMVSIRLSPRLIFRMRKNEALLLLHLRDKLKVAFCQFLRGGPVRMLDPGCAANQALVGFLGKEEKSLNLPEALNIGLKTKGTSGDCYSAPPSDDLRGLSKKRTNVAEVVPGGAAYFVVKVNHRRMLQAAVEDNQWPLHYATEKKLLKHIRLKDRVFLLLNDFEHSVFHGCLYIMTLDGVGLKAENVREEFRYNYLSYPYRIKWECRCWLLHDQTRHLRDSDNVRVDSLRDGSEIPERAATELIRLMRENPVRSAQVQNTCLPRGVRAPTGDFQIRNDYYVQNVEYATHHSNGRKSNETEGKFGKDENWNDRQLGMGTNM
ncbi:unnamed protein product [Notodromas monacha]|uniref:RNA helicase n=1 Tax=Notodromas monacha TaxID=399045 RepID=A0A7R9GGR6_9CRUS|nr:unnamed protein product [Notodromas monacha]CAG0922008.1 unnamed protein product [Notodromas monacha]